jgi:hypothetical protein
VRISGRLLRALALLFAGVLVFADSPWLSGPGFCGVVATLLAIGWVEGRLRAVWWAAILVGSAAVADELWWLDWAPFNRDADYEAIPQTPFVVIGLPAPIALVALGVGAGALWRRARRRSAPA